MARSKDAKIKMESGRTLKPFATMTDSGDAQTFNPASAIMSGLEGFTPEVLPNGIVTGRNIAFVAASGSNDVIDAKAHTGYLAGVLTAVAADTDISITRPATNVSKINILTVTSAGIYAMIAGLDGTTTAFSETVGAAGGPPEIPVDSYAVAQVQVISSTAAPIADSEIFQVVGQHTERYDYPTFEINNIGLGYNADVAAQVNAFVKFNAALPLTHTGGVTKSVYIKYYEPVFADLLKPSDFVPAEKSYSVSSEEYYGGSVAGSSESLGQASFTALLTDGVSDAEVSAKGKTATFMFYPNRNKTPYILTQGIVGITRSFAVADNIQASVTVSSETESADFIN